MGHEWTEELVWAEAADGVELEGIVCRPAEGRPLGIPVVSVHGAGGSFYARGRVMVGRMLAAAGHPVLFGNNRGHDMGAALRRRGGEDVLGGVWWEKLSEAHLDVAAWIDRAGELGHQRVALMGISLGATKALWYQADRQDPRVAGLVLASGPIWPYRWMRSRPERIALAERMEAEGRGQDLLPWGDGGFRTMSAASLLERLRSLPDLFGLETPEGAGIGRIACPILAFYGTAEPDMGTAAELELIRRNARAASRVDTAMPEGVDHSWRGHPEPVAELIHGWLTTALAG